jgi:hypothetical protein
VQQWLAGQIQKLAERPKGRELWVTGPGLCFTDERKKVSKQLLPIRRLVTTLHVPFLETCGD